MSRYVFRNPCLDLHHHVIKSKHAHPHIRFLDGSENVASRISSGSPDIGAFVLARHKQERQNLIKIKKTKIQMSKTNISNEHVVLLLRRRKSLDEGHEAAHQHGDTVLPGHDRSSTSWHCTNLLGSGLIQQGEHLLGACEQGESSLQHSATLSKDINYCDDTLGREDPRHRGAHAEEMQPDVKDRPEELACVIHL